MSRLEEIQGNWEYERVIKPEDVDYLIERVEELESNVDSLIEKRSWDRKRLKEFSSEKNRYKQALEESKQHLYRVQGFEPAVIETMETINIALAGDTE